jgi:hypothetical protein
VEGQIEYCETKLVEAIKFRDIKLLDELLHEALLFNIPNGKTITKKMDIENNRLGIVTFDHIIATDRIIKVVDDFATVTVTVQLKANYINQIIEGKFKYLRVWKLTKKKWQVIAGSAFQIN